MSAPSRTAQSLNLYFWQSVGFFEALPNGRLAAESKKDKESSEKIATAGKPKEDLGEGVALLLMQRLQPPVVKDSMNGFSDPEDSKQEE